MTKYTRGTDAHRPLPLDKKISRIAESLTQLALEPDAPREEDAFSAADLEVSEETVGWLIRARRDRARYLPVGLFADPVWDMLLSLLHAELTSRRLSVSAVCLASGFSESNGLRWLNAMVEHGFVSRKIDANNRAAEFVQLVPKISRALRLYFREVVETR
jgi:hypothetical protein